MQVQKTSSNNNKSRCEISAWVARVPRNTPASRTINSELSRASQVTYRSLFAASHQENIASACKSCRSASPSTFTCPTLWPCTLSARAQSPSFGVRLYAASRVPGLGRRVSDPILSYCCLHISPISLFLFPRFSAITITARSAVHH